MGAENPFELSADAFDGGARTLVANVGVQADAEHLPGFEGMRQHEQLGFGVGRRAEGRASQPGVADLAGVGVVASVARMTLRPRPSLQVKEARGADDAASSTRTVANGNAVPASSQVRAVST